MNKAAKLEKKRIFPSGRKDLRKSLPLIVAVILIGGLIASLFSLKNRMDTRSRAVDTGPVLSMAPETISKTVGDSFDVGLILTTNESTVSAVKVHIGFDPTSIRLDTFTPGTILPVELPAPTPAGDGEYVFILGSQPTTPFKGTGIIGTLRFTALSAKQSTITYTSSTQVAALGQSTNALVRSSGATVTVARAEGPILFMDPAATTLQVGQSFPLHVMIDSKGTNVSATEIHIGFDPTAVRIDGFTPGTILPVVLPSPTPSGSGEYIFILGSQPTSPFSGIDKLGTLTISILAAKQSSLTFTSNTQVAILGQNFNALSSSTGATVIGSDVPVTPTNTPITVHSPTHTPSRTPSATRTPTPSHTPNPNYTPTNTPIISNTPSRTPTQVPSSTPSRTPTQGTAASQTPSRTPTAGTGGGFTNTAPNCLSISANPSTGTRSLTTTITCTGSDADNDIVSAEFDFGNGVKRTVDKNVGVFGSISTSYTFSAVGYYTVTCRVKDNNMAFSSIPSTCIQTVQVKAATGGGYTYPTSTTAPYAYVSPTGSYEEVPYTYETLTPYPTYEGYPTPTDVDYYPFASPTPTPARGLLNEGQIVQIGKILLIAIAAIIIALILRKIIVGSDTPRQP